MRNSRLLSAVCLFANGLGFASSTTYFFVAAVDARAAETTFRLRGRIDADAVWTSQSAANKATFGDLGDVVRLRRTRIGAEGNLAVGGRYVTEIDLATGEVVLRDVFAGEPNSGTSAANIFATRPAVFW